MSCRDKLISKCERKMTQVVELINFTQYAIIVVGTNNTVPSADFAMSWWRFHIPDSRSPSSGRQHPQVEGAW